VILLDTHTLAWLSAGSPHLSRSANSAIRRAQRTDGIAISAITLWELAFLVSRGRLGIVGTLEDYLELVTSRATVFPITHQVAIAATQLPLNFPTDPCDRLIAATAITEGISLVTKDSRMRESKHLQTIW
jgi:PIN domain nuclease of toxin-antitoxin system